MSTPLYLAAGQTKFFVHPIVVFSILDAYKRRSTDQENVIGTLLGERENGKITIMECFPVNYVTENGVLKLNTPHHDTMLALARRVNPRLHVLGWFTSSDRTDAAWPQVTEEYASRTVPGTRPLIFSVGAALRKDTLDMALYACSQVAFNGTVLHTRFESIPYSLIDDPILRTSLDAIVSGRPLTEAFDAPAAFLSDEEALSSSLVALRSSLRTVAAHLEAVAAGRAKPDPSVGRAVVAALTKIPAVDRAALLASYSASEGSAPPAAVAAAATSVSAGTQQQETLLLVYLAKVAATEVALVDRVNVLIQ